MHMNRDISHSDTLDWSPGDTLPGDYEVVERIASGGMGTVYKVRHTVQNEYFAVKVPHAHLFRRPEDRVGFVSEVQHWVAMPSHPHLVRCFFVREADQCPMVFAEYVSGGTLAQLIEDGRIESAEHALKLALQFAEGMVLAQSTGIVHRDLKPSNCLIDEDGSLKIADFGLAAAADRISRSSDRRNMGFSGTAAYCSPEQLDGDPVDSRADVWSFAVTLFETLTGQRPMLGPAARGLVENYRPADDAFPIPDDLIGFLLSLLVDVDGRPSQFLDVAARLAAIYQSVSGHNFQSQAATDRSTQPPEPVAGAASADHDHDDSDLDFSGILRTSVSSFMGRDFALKILQRALKRAGRNPEEAHELEPDGPRGSRGQTSELMAGQGLLREALHIYEPLVDGTADTGLLQEYFATLHLLAQTSLLLGDMNAAIGFHTRTIQTAEQQPNWKQQRLLLLGVFEARGNRAIVQRQNEQVLQAIQDYDAALELTQEPTAVAQQLFSGEMTAALLQNRAMALITVQRLQDARSDIDRAITLQIPVVQQSADDKQTGMLASMYTDRGVIRRRQSDTNGAIGDYTEAIALYGRISAPSATQESQLAMTHLNRGAAYLAQEQCQSGLEDANESIRRFRQLTETQGMEDQLFLLSQAYNNRSQMRMGLGNLAGATEDGLRCIDLRKQVVRDQGRTQHLPDLGKAMLNQMVIHINAQQLPQAAKAGQESIRVLESLKDLRSTVTTQHLLAKARSLYGSILCMQQQPQQALDQYSAAARALLDLIPNGMADVVSASTELVLMATGISLEVRIVQFAETVHPLLNAIAKHIPASRLPANSRMHVQALQQALQAAPNLNSTPLYSEMLQTLGRLQS